MSKKRQQRQRAQQANLPASSAAAHTSSMADKAVLPLGALMLAASVSSWAQTQPAPGAAPAAAASAGAEATLGTVTIKDRAEVQSKDTIQTKKSSIGRSTQDIRDIPQSLTVLTEKMIDDAKLDTLKQALHYTSGVTFAATENGTDQDIRIRGFPVATVGDLMIDGMKDPSQYDRDTFNYDRIEVLRGSASLLFGRGSTGGVVNQVNKKPLLIDQYEVEGTYGTDNVLRTTADLNKTMGEDAAFRLNLMRTKGDNHGAEIDKYGIAPTYSWGIGTRDEFSVGAFYLNSDNNPMSNIRYLQGSVPHLNPKNYYGTDSDYLKGEASYANASWIHRFDDGSEWKTQARAGVFDRSQWGTTASFGTTNGAPTTWANIGDNTILNLSGLSPRKDRHKGLYLQSDYSTKANWGGMKHELQMGVDFSREMATFWAAKGQPGTNYNKGQTTIGEPDSVGETALTPSYRFDQKYSAHSMGAYVQDLVEFSPGWKLLGGLRWDRVSSNQNRDVYTSGVLTGNESSELRYNSLFSQRLGLLYQPNDFASFHVAYSTSFNSSADTYKYTSQQTANTDPEKSRNFEIGAKLDWLDGKLSTRAALFRTEKYNERTTDADFAGDAYLLNGKRHAQGLEFDVVGRITPQWDVYASYTYIPTAKIDKTGSAAANTVGQRVGLTPKHSGSVWLGYQATPKLRVAGGVRGMSENRPVSGTTGAASATARAPGYVAVDLMAEYQFTDNISAKLNINNAFNRSYGDQLYPGFVTLGEARNIRATVKYRF
ncbi:TonB-dependent receptor [Comamonas sp. J-3]|uniref:TonB-dependent receptor n=1 Tax=Comamonas trifloxystrobinivorans TaxID=3350256 RepID=UPI00372A2ACC